MRASPFIKPLEKEAVEWDETLNRLQEVVDNWLACQATWQYLEPIFTSPDIMKQMPEEGDKFLQVLFYILASCLATILQQPEEPAVVCVGFGCLNVPACSIYRLCFATLRLL